MEPTEASTSTSTDAPASVESKLDILRQMKSNLEKSIKYKDLSTKAAKASAMNIEQVTKYKKLRLRFWIIVGILFAIFIAYAVFFCLIEYSDVRSFMNQYGEKAGVPISGFQMALVLKYPAISGWFQIENKAFPVAVLLSLRTSTFSEIFKRDPVCNLQTLYSFSLYGKADVTSDSGMVTSALELICNSYGGDGTSNCQGAESIAVCSGPCDYNSGSGNLASTASGLQMAGTLGNLGSLVGPWGTLAGTAVGFIAGFVMNKYAGSDSNSKANCVEAPE